jgi:hypothetical protein
MVNEPAIRPDSVMYHAAYGGGAGSRPPTASKAYPEPYAAMTFSHMNESGHPCQYSLVGNKLASEGVLLEEYRYCTLRVHKRKIVYGRTHVRYRYCTIVISGQ